MMKTVRCIPFGFGRICSTITKQEVGYILAFFELKEPVEVGGNVIDENVKGLIPEIFNSLYFKNKESVDVVIEYLEKIKEKFIEEENKV